MGNPYARDKLYPKPPRWGRLYGRYFPKFTDSSSRHVKTIAESMRDTRSHLRKLLIDAGYEPDHWAASMELTVKVLWEARAKLASPNRDSETGGK